MPRNKETIYDGFIFTENDLKKLNNGEEIKFKSSNGKKYLFSKEVKEKSQFYDISFNVYENGLMIVEDGLFNIFATGKDSAIDKLRKKFKGKQVEVIKLKTVRGSINA